MTTHDADERLAQLAHCQQANTTITVPPSVPGNRLAVKLGPKLAAKFPRVTLGHDTGRSSSHRRDDLGPALGPTNYHAHTQAPDLDSRHQAPDLAHFHDSLTVRDSRFSITSPAAGAPHANEVRAGWSHSAGASSSG